VGTEEWAPPGIDTSRPSIARVYDYMLGGKDNFAIDRKTGEMALRITPDGPEAARGNRAFLRRVVHHLTAEAGIRQFLDLGSGLPTQGNVHEIAQRVDPTTRVVYVDSDPMVLAHGRALLADSRTTTVIQADFREPDKILSDPVVRDFIDFDQPVGLLLFGVLHHIRDDEKPGQIAAQFREPLVVGSHVAVSHFQDPGASHPEASAKALAVEKIFNETLGTGRWRAHEEILAYFGDWDILEPGLVPFPEWRPGPDDHTEQTDTYYTFVGGLARRSR
jgi:hypothetical protein